MSEDPDLKNVGKYFADNIIDCKIEYLAKGEFRKYDNGKIAKLPSKYSILYVTSKDVEYNKIILKMLTVYGQLTSYFNSIEHNSFINLSFFSKDMISLEFDSNVLFLLSKYHFSLPVSCYYEKEIE
jgi:hypothetical protein